MDEPRNHSYAPMVPTQLNALKQKLESFKLAENITEQDLQGLLEDWYAAESEWLVAGEYSSGLLALLMEIFATQQSNYVENFLAPLVAIWFRFEVHCRHEGPAIHEAFLYLTRVFREFAETKPETLIPHLNALTRFWICPKHVCDKSRSYAKPALVNLFTTFYLVAKPESRDVSQYIKVQIEVWQQARHLWDEADYFSLHSLLCLITQVCNFLSWQIKGNGLSFYIDNLMLLWNDSKLLLFDAENKLNMLSFIVFSFYNLSKINVDYFYPYVNSIFNSCSELMTLSNRHSSCAQIILINYGNLLINTAPGCLPAGSIKYLVDYYSDLSNALIAPNHKHDLFSTLSRLISKVGVLNRKNFPDLSAVLLIKNWFSSNGMNHKLSKKDCGSLCDLSLGIGESSMKFPEEVSGILPTFKVLLTDFNWQENLKDGCVCLANFYISVARLIESRNIINVSFSDLTCLWQRTLHLRDSPINSLHSEASVSALAEYLHLAAVFSKRYPSKLTVNDALNIIEVNFYDYENLHADQVKRAIQNYWIAILNLNRAGLISIYDLRIRIIPKWFLQNKFWNARAFENLLLLLSGDGSHARLLSFIPYCTLFFPSSNRTTLSIGLLSSLENGNPIESAFRRSFLPKKLIITAEECCNLINGNSDDLIKNSEISLRKQRCLACPLALYMSRFIAEACAYSSRPGYFIPDLDYLLLFRGALLLKPLHCKLSPRRMLLSYSLDIKTNLVALSETERGLQALRDARFVFDDEVGELLPVNLWGGGLHQVWARYRFNQRLKHAFPVLMEQNQRHHKAITGRIADGARCLVFWLADALQRLTQLEVLGSAVDFELSDLIRWHMGRGTLLEAWPWVSYASCQQAVAMMREQGAEIPSSLVWLSDSEGNYEALKSAFTRLVRQSHRVAALSKVLETTERESEQSRSPNACLDALSEQVKDEIAALPEDITQLHPIAYEVIDLGLEHLLRACTEQWVNQTLMFLLPDISAEGFWPAWVTMVDAVLSHPDLGVQELHPPELEEGLLAWVAAGLDDAQEDEKVWSLLMHQTAALDLLNAKLPNHYSSWVQDTDRILAEVFQKDETYHCEHNRTLWEPFEVWQVQLAKLMPVLPTIAQVQEKLTATEAMVLLYEAKQALHALLVAKSSVSRIKLSDNWHECAEPLQAEFASWDGAKVIAAIEAGNQQAWAEHSNWHETVCDVLKSAIPENTDCLFILPGTTSNMPWEWALKKQGCAPVTRLVSVPAFLASVSNDVTSTAIVQGHIEAQTLDPDFTAMRALWSQESAPVTSITETLLSLKEAQQLHYFGHGQTDANHGGGNYLSMASHKLFTRLLPLTDIHAGVINLSACYSAQSKHSIGLGHVLVGSGASHVIGCLWRAEAVSLYCFNRLLRDLSKNSHLTKAVFEQAQQRLSQLTLEQVKDWVAEAKSEQLNNNASYLEWLDINDIQPIFAHPYFWAGYVWLDRG